MTITIVLDPGHGGHDPGAVAKGLQEKDVALQISLAAAERLKAKYEGIRVLLTRTADVFVPLPERTSIANRERADAFVSVHCNAGGGAGGFETYMYSRSANPNTSELQRVLHSEIWRRINPIGVDRDRGPKKADLYVCRETNMPAVLIECLFIDVPADAERLRRADVLDALADGIAAGLASYFGLTSDNQPVSVRIEVNGKYVANGDAIDGRTWGPARIVGEALGASIGWVDRTVTVNGVKLPTRLIGTAGWVPLRPLADVVRARISWDGKSNTVKLKM
ncbi:cell wall hydrolase [Paenibacillus sp. 32O-W]|uniref:N-acetylmuramoyl-L-alanine amidase n=1 Tax=Paenibacillus sp. 32O-W TaxID=1695218 RepID=UPI000720E74E|nr:N-acetylmuramoyl-L-alanine amidase [Paenibacillus sp. 32O-W]ALS25478.1 cell wall hydrolase [Paenibacillus sp. 32O-W]